jgi:hypothetical protein
MIILQMRLIPYGSTLFPAAELITAEIFTLPFGPARHGFRILDNEQNVLTEGSIAKIHSGHRNPLHLLRDVLASVDLDALGHDYITTSYDN